MCCFDDLIPFTEILKPGEVETVRAKVTEVAAKKDNLVCSLMSSCPVLLTAAEPLNFFYILQTLNEARRIINALKTLRYLSSEQTAEEEASTAQDYLERYFSALALGSYSITRA